MSASISTPPQQISAGTGGERMIMISVEHTALFRRSPGFIGVMPVGTMVPVLQAMQYIVTEQLGAMLTGTSPREYVADIRTTILYILNVLVTRQRPRFFLLDPRYKRAKARVSELGRRMIAEYHAGKASRDPARRNLVDDIMEAHERDPDLMPESDLILSLTGPFVAGLDTVANTTAAFVYAVLKHPDVLERVRNEADALFAQGSIDEADLKRVPSIDGAVMEAMRLYPIAVAQMRTAAVRTPASARPWPRCR